MESIREEEWIRLKKPDPSLYISDFNRNVLLAMEKDESAFGDQNISCEMLRAMHHDLAVYLNRYMKDHPDAHRWIILSCICLAASGLPLHPREAAHWKYSDGHYYCSYHTDEEGSVCRYCVCKKMP